jgi:hypothetical protein
VYNRPVTRTNYERCARCAGPLEGTRGQVVVTCAYCGTENRLVSLAHERLTTAATESRRLAADLDARAEELRVAYERDYERAVLNGDRTTGASALRHLEGWLRLQYEPTLHLYRSMPPDDPTVSEALAQIDEVIDRALTAAAEPLGIPYRTVRERLEDPR